MDAMVDDHVVTPRSGKPIELQGLWYACCRVVAQEARRRQEGSLEEAASAAAAAVRESFHRTYWMEALGWYADCVTDDGTLDSSLRPNQLVPMSLRFRPVETGAARRALAVIEEHLLTPFGLRTLSPRHPEYRGHYGGDVAARDFAYHQGTVWPWLLGPYGRACLHLRGRRERDRLRELLEPLLAWMARDGMGSLPEVFDGDEPYSPGGCPAQAWSVAEVRSLLAELDHEPDGYDPVEV
jgi:glycogen debranching enzyme